MYHISFLSAITSTFPSAAPLVLMISARRRTPSLAVFTYGRITVGIADSARPSLT